jgi:DnaJ-class molecular chaperone
MVDRTRNRLRAIVGNNREWLRTDFYAVLGVSKDATELDIKRSYRALARMHHPDANNGDSGAEERFKGIVQAYDVLSKASERSRYDRMRAVVPFQGLRPSGFRQHADTGAAFRPVYQPPVRGRDLDARVVLSTREARRGLTVPVETVELGRTSRTVFVRIPPGISDGQRIKVEGRGGYGLNGGKTGDLYVTARVFSPQILSQNPHLDAFRVGRQKAPVTLADVPRVVRKLAHFLLNPNDVELNEALSSPTDTRWAQEIIRQRRAMRR